VTPPVPSLARPVGMATSATLVVYFVPVALLHQDHNVLDVEPETHSPERIRLLIQITVFLEILTSCFLRLEMVWFISWANQPSRTPRNRSPSGWRTEGKCARLVSGMPNVSSTGLKGERSKS
jgi:hypothetical protein